MNDVHNFLNFADREGFGSSSSNWLQAYATVMAAMSYRNILFLVIFYQLK